MNQATLNAMEPSELVTRIVDLRPVKKSGKASREETAMREQLVALQGAADAERLIEDERAERAKETSHGNP